MLCACGYVNRTRWRKPRSIVRFYAKIYHYCLFKKKTQICVWSKTMVKNRTYFHICIVQTQTISGDIEMFKWNLKWLLTANHMFVWKWNQMWCAMESDTSKTKAYADIRGSKVRHKFLFDSKHLCACTTFRCRCGIDKVSRIPKKTIFQRNFDAYASVIRVDIDINDDDNDGDKWTFENRVASHQIEFQHSEKIRRINVAHVEHIRATRSSGKGTWTVSN